MTGKLGLCRGFMKQGFSYDFSGWYTVGEGIDLMIRLSLGL